MGGRILDTLTRLYFSILASLSASSKDANLSLWTPVPFVKNAFLGIIFTPYFLVLLMSAVRFSTVWATITQINDISLI
ncbi:hypothetical protein DU80_03550 [Methanosarcina mazei]|uniref:Uncharacterized protein n=1 Tax=Methanosarcina mazei TaxID=2209 RepID=A0A0F8G5L5_METMZ|nr:hypothetical protein DU47_02465 [Methanosarcina mazei]KKG03336.1 hypothetical protein DU31_12555 [Methanosarcina mazei]KKG04767.1 hypothetical protein DU40_20180 [Methanosarcina mazei]KKG07661.1 hypothetical protein DU34_12370 [Methanosarcina mazei]KKG31985.1 hypothetical protein DU49_11660 [Methanosarcina mazei]